MLKHRIVGSILATLGVVALTQAVASAQDSRGGDPGDAGKFGQLASPTAEEPSTPEPSSPGVRSAACASGNVCFWKQANFDGDREEAGANLALEDRLLGAYDNSAKNRFGSRKVLIKDSNFQQIDCINADGERTQLVASAAIFRIGAVGSNC